MNFYNLEQSGTKKQKQFSKFRERIAYLLDKYHPQQYQLQHFQQYPTYFPKQTFLDDYY